MDAEDAAGQHRELGALRAFARLLGTNAASDEVASCIVEGARQATGADFAALFLLEPGGLRIAASDPPQKPPFEAPAVVEVGECLCGLAVRQMGPLYSSDLHADPRCVLASCRSIGVRSFAALPISGQAEVLGALGVGSKTPRDFAAQAPFLESLAAMAGIALTNTSLRARLKGEVTMAESLVQSLPGIFYVLGPGGEMLRWNSNFEALSGYSGAELRHLRAAEFFRGDDRALIAERIALVFEQGQADALADFVSRDGTATPYYFTGRRTLFAGSPALIGVGVNISERLRAEAALRDLSTAVTASGDVVFMTDSDGTFASVNPEFTAVYGWEAAEVVGRVTPRILKSGVHTTETYRAFWDTVLRGELFRGEVVNRARDGRLVHVEETVNSFRDSKGQVRGFLAIQRDVTERRRIEDERARLQAQLGASQRLEAIGRLAGGVAHDFNNLLLVMLNGAQFAAGALPASSPAHADLADVVEAAKRAAVLTRQLLAFSRRQTLELKVLDVNQAVSEVLSMLGRLLGDDVVIRTSLAPDTGRVRADRGQLEQVLVNLAINARDAMPGGGTLTISTSNRQTEGTGAPARCVRISVEDTGTGMDAATREHAFEPFFTTKGPEKGTGLGLATVYGIVTQSGGSVHLYSEPGRGTAFHLDFPRVELPAEAPVGEAHDVVRGSASVLLVEDQDAVRRVTERILAEAGYRVTAASGAHEALAACAQRRTAFDLLVTDVVMPQMSGLELAARLTAQWPELRVLVISGFSDTAAPEAGRRLPHRLNKPYSAAELTAAVHRALASEG